MGKRKKQNVKEEAIDLSMAEKVLDRYEGVDGSLIPILQKVQNEYGYLQEPVINLIAERMNVNASEIIGVATFYAQFHLKPRGAHIVRVCCGTACHVKNAKGLSDKIQERFKINKGETTEDKMYTYEEVPCVGACGIAPVVVFDNDIHGTLSPEKLDKVLDGYSVSKT
ncbi:MAG: NADH-quinone oxidoreductase subunit NuoE [Candidatus Scalindua sp.]|nr:NADH-quinone oxidoreductase subunit NuoE [Candidatus Scalindua sp.]